MPKLVAVQVLRGLAALAIALLHLEPDWRLRGAVPEGWVRPFPLEAGVDVFFVVSGFVMVYASAGLFGRAGAARLFLARRIARIVPLYWLTTAGVLAILALRPDLMRSAVATPELVVASLLFVPWPRPDGILQPIYTLGWTLNYEMFFYVLFAMALALRLSRRSTVVVTSLVMLGLIGLGWALRPLPSSPLAVWTSSLLLTFVLGMAIGVARAEGLTLPLAARLGLAAAGIGLFWLIGGDVARTGRDTAFVFALPSACLVAACGLSPGRPDGYPRDRAPSHWLARAGESLGDASYAIYLLHPFAIRGTLVVLDRLGLSPALGTAGITFAALIATIVVALLSYRLIERPMTRRVRGWIEPRREQTP